MGLEIEKKYLVKYFPSEVENQFSTPVPLILQGYLKTGVDYEVRISNRLHLTTKKGSGLVREENVYEISQEVYNALLPLTIGKQIHKERRIFELDNGLFAELDIYYGKNKGIITVEVEFPDEETANNFIPPDWFGEDVSEKLEYKNSILAK